MSAGEELVCVVCDSSHMLPALKTHMFREHHLVIEFIESIPLLPVYLAALKKRLSSGTSLADVAVCIQTSADTSSAADAATGAADTSEFYMLTEQVPAEAAVRSALRVEATERLRAQQAEEAAAWAGDELCVFCDTFTAPSIQDMLSHMHTEHHFNVGAARNLVNVPELLALVKQRLEDRICLHCERQFDTAKGLRNHMRKKWHYSIDDMNPVYDRFYIANAGAQRPRLSVRERPLVQPQSSPGVDPNADPNADPDDDVSDDGMTPEERARATACPCLVCPFVATSPADAVAHAHTAHGMDLTQGDVYSRLRFVNWTRHQIAQGLCPVCDAPQEDTLSHVHETGHDNPLARDDAPWMASEQWFQPHDPNDPLLAAMLLASDDADDTTDVGVVTAERVPVTEEDLTRVAGIAAHLRIGEPRHARNKPAPAAPPSDDDSSLGGDVPVDATPVLCLFCEHVDASCGSLLAAHLPSAHGTSWEPVAALPDAYDRIRVANYIRHCVVQGVCPFTGETTDDLAAHLAAAFPEGASDALAALAASPDTWDDTAAEAAGVESFLIPIIPSDPLLSWLVLGDEDDGEFSSDEGALCDAELGGAGNGVLLQESDIVEGVVPESVALPSVEDMERMSFIRTVIHGTKPATAPAAH